jgi:hypothetical protein
VFRQSEESKYRFRLEGLAGGGIMETLRSVLVPASHAFAVRGHDAAAAARSHRNVRLIAPSGRASFAAVFSAESFARGVPSSREKTELVMAMQSGVEENAASSTSLPAG